MARQKLRGLVGQSLSGDRPPLTGLFYSVKRGPAVFTVPKSGKYQIVAWGAGGGGGGVAGGSGAMVSGIRYLVKGQQVVASIGAGGTLNSDGTATTVTLPNGDLMTAGGGFNGFSASGAGGVASSTNSLDEVVPGQSQIANVGGAAPPFQNIVSAPGGDGSRPANRGAGGSNTGLTAHGANGEVVIYQVQLRR